MKGKDSKTSEPIQKVVIVSASGQRLLLENATTEQIKALLDS